MDKTLDVVCVGAAIVDVPLQPVSRNIFDSESYPLEQISMTIGGDAINESTIITRLGGKVGLMSLVGNDAVGDYIIRHCDTVGINHEGVRRVDGIDTSINVALITEDGERTFVTNRNGSLWKLCGDDIDLSLIPRGKILSMASFFNSPRLDNDAIVKIFKVAKDAGMIIVADMIKPRLGETFNDIAGALSYVDYFFPNVEEAEQMTGENTVEAVAEKILTYGVKNVIIKIGRKGSLIDGVGYEPFVVPAVEGITALDTTGAGDNFASGFITGLLEGKDVRECGEYGNVAASIAIQSIGATTGITGRDVFDVRMAQYRAQNPR